MKQFNEDGSSFTRVGNKKKNTKDLALIKSVDGMQNLNESEISEGMRIIDKTSTSKQNKRKRMGNFLNDVTGRNLL
tara:strand:+ start:246 stop:473 length:228 start_codon:yes stop_codon:yes gene_type:complete